MKLPSKIGAVEFEGDTIRLAVVNTGGRMPSITDACACRAVYEDANERFDALAAAAAHALSQIRSKPAAWVLCARSDCAIARKLTLPFRGKRKVAAAVPFELEPYLAFSIDELAVDYSVIREAGGTTDVLALGVRRTLLEEQLDVLRTAGVEVEGIGLDAAGLTSLLRAKVGGGKQLSAVLHVRETGSALVVTAGTSLVFLRHLPLTAAQFREMPASAAREVQNTLRAFQASWTDEDAALSELFVTGQAMTEFHRVDFEDELAVAVQYVDLLDGVKGAGLAQTQARAIAVGVSGAASEVPDATDEEHGESNGANTWAALGGVALTAAGGPYGLNFRSGPLAAPNAWAGLIRHAVFSACLVLVLIAGYSVYAYANYQQNREEIERIGDTIWEYYTEAFPDAPDVRGGRPSADAGGSHTIELMARDNREAREGESGSDLDIFQRPPLPELLKEISLRMPESDVQVTSVRITSTLRRGELQSVLIEGEVQDAAAFDGVVAALRASDLFEQVEDPQRRDEAGRATFSIRAYF